MWKHHFIISGVLILLAVPIYLMDKHFLKPSQGGFIALDFRGFVTLGYLILLVLHLSLSTTWLYFGKDVSLPRTHLISFPVSIVLLVVVSYGAIIFFESAERRQRVAILENRKNLYEVINLKKWWYAPNADHPEEVYVKLTFGKKGRFAATIEGWEEGEYGEQIFVGSLDHQIQIEKGETVTAILKVKHYNPGDVKEVRIFFYLFDKDVGSSVMDLSKFYFDNPKLRGNGKDFYEQLPPQSPM